MKADYFSADVIEFIDLLHSHNVQYLLIGGEAVIYYGNVRLTGDIDFFYNRESENVAALYEVLLDFWDGDIPGINKSAVLKNPDYMVQFGVPPNRIDLLNDIAGVNFEEAWQSKITEEIRTENKTVSLYIIGLQHLIANKAKVGRNKDQEDLKYLRSIID